MTIQRPGSQSVRIGGQVYQVNISQAQVDARNIDRERARQLSRETARRRRALENRRQQNELAEEKKRQIELTKRREKQREATERYQRANIPQRRRFSSPVLDKAYSTPVLSADVHHLHSLSDTRFQTAKVNFVPKRPQSTQVSNRDDIDKHRARTALHRSAFNEEFQRQLEPTKDKTSQNFARPVPPTYPRPSTVKSAWENSGSKNPVSDRAESSSSESEIDDAENSTFIVEENVGETELRRCSTPDHGDQAEMVPKPPEVPRPNSTHPKNEKLKSKIETTQPTQSETTKNAEKIESERKSEVKGILKRRVTRRIVSASGNRGIIAASIKDSLELAGAVKDDSRTKSVRWEKLYYDDGSVAEFASDGTPKPIPEKSKNKNDRRVQLKDTKSKTSSVKKVTPKVKKGKRGKKIEKEPEAAPVSQMSHRYGSYSIAPTPSASATLKTEQPLLKPENQNVHQNQISSRIPMPPQVARPLTSRTQILRSKRFVPSTTPIKATFKMNSHQADSKYTVNSNNQVSVHIGSIELSPDINRTPTENDIAWLWDRVRTVLENQQNAPKRPRPSSGVPKSSSHPRFSKRRPQSAHAGGSQTAFELAEQMAERNVPDSRIMNVINLPGPATTLSLEEQQIEQSLQRLDDRLLTLQETVGYNGIAFHNRH